MSGRDNDLRAGYPNGDSRETPVDLAAVQADDALLDMLSSASHMASDTDEELTRVLVAWRREVHADSNRVLVDTDTALAVVSAARRPTRRRNPVFGTLAAAAAVLVIAFSAVGLVAKSAEPGDQLWGVTKVLYSEYARSVEAATFVRTELNEARTALREGKPEQAKAKLQRIQQRLPAVGEAEGRTDLIARQQDLEKMLVGQSGSSKEDSSTGSLDSGSSARSTAPETPSSIPTSEPSPTTHRGSVSSSEPQPSPTPQVGSTPQPSPTPQVGSTPIATPVPTGSAHVDEEPHPTPGPDDGRLSDSPAPEDGPPPGRPSGPGVPSPSG